MMRAILVALVAFAAACGDGECFTPEGDYRLELADAGGTCSAGFVAAIESGSTTVDIEPDRMCGFYSNESPPIDAGNGCTLVVRLQGEATESGIEDATAEATITCSDGSTCTHTFDATFTKL